MELIMPYENYIAPEWLNLNLLCKRRTTPFVLCKLIFITSTML